MLQLFPGGGGPGGEAVTFARVYCAWCQKPMAVEESKRYMTHNCPDCIESYRKKFGVRRPVAKPDDKDKPK